MENRVIKTFSLEENANNIEIYRDFEDFRILIHHIESGKTFFIEENGDVEAKKDIDPSKIVGLANFVNKQLPKDVKALKTLESDNLFANAKINATTLMISGKVIMQSKYALREDLLAFEALLNKHEKFLLATIDETILTHEEALNDSFNASPVSY